MVKKLSRLLVLLALGFVTSEARANPVDTFGFGARSTALGGAVSADVEDFSANYYNPAGLVRGNQIRIEGGYIFVSPQLKIDQRSAGVDSVHAATAGLIVPANFGSHRFALGLGLHLNDERVSRTRSLPASEPRWEFYDNRPQRIYLSANLAWAPTKWLRIGGGISFMATSDTQLNVDGTIPVLGAERGSKLEHSLRTDLLSVRYPAFGIQIEPNKHWSFGLVYRGQFKLGLNLDATVRAQLTLGTISVPAIFDLLSKSVNTFLPQQISLGSAWRPTDNVRVSAELTWVNWSAYQTSVSYTDVTLQLMVPPALSSLVSNPGQIAGSRPIPGNFQDRFVPRVGVEWRAFESHALALDVRGGYYFEKSPIPPQSSLTNFVDSDRHVFSIGAGLTLLHLEPIVRGTVYFDTTFQYSYFMPRAIIKDSTLDTTGNYLATGSIYAISANVGVTFR